MTSPAAPSPQSGVGNVHKSGPVHVVKKGAPKPTAKKGGKR